MTLLSSEKIISTAPLRLGLAGGGTDVPPYCTHNMGEIVNASISLRVYSILGVLPNAPFLFKSEDINEHCWMGYRPTKGKGKGASTLVPLVDDIENDDSCRLIRAVYSYVTENIKQPNDLLYVNVITQSDVPMGSGLGASSAIVISLVAGFFKLLNIEVNREFIAKAAYHVEREYLGLPGGMQDYYSAAYGGFNHIKINKDIVSVQQLNVSTEVTNYLEISLVILFTGSSRNTDKINEAYKMDYSVGTTAREFMKNLSWDANELARGLVSGKLSHQLLIKILDNSHTVKTALIPSSSNERLDEIYDKAKEFGARAGKISGAGGGGFMYFLVDPQDRTNFIRRMMKWGSYLVMPFSFTNKGVEAWRLYG